VDAQAQANSIIDVNNAEDIYFPLVPPRLLHAFSSFSLIHQNSFAARSPELMI